MAALQKITPCLWFDSEAEEAAHFYVSVFKNADQQDQPLQQGRMIELLAKHAQMQRTRLL
jgi:predicted 3-demethylubiquinone-9 3-methyltransferase (glyoxalase superfamily)